MDILQDHLVATEGGTSHDCRIPFHSQARLPTCGCSGLGVGFGEGLEPLSTDSADKSEKLLIT
jgi:hypothetical protein